jgi:hypothetical protein
VAQLDLLGSLLYVQEAGRNQFITDRQTFGLDWAAFLHTLASNLDKHAGLRSKLQNSNPLTKQSYIQVTAIHLRIPDSEDTNKISRSNKPRGRFPRPWMGRIAVPLVT